MINTMEKNIITVVVPLYNSRDTIARCLESIRRQTFTEYEIIVIDDGSTDGGAEVAKKYLGPRDQLVSQENSGVSAARNRGIEVSSGRYISFLDADDEWDAFFLQAVYDLSLHYAGAGMYSTGYRIVFPAGDAVEIVLEEAEAEGSCLITDYFRRALHEHFIWTGCVLIPKEVLTAIGGFPLNVSRGEDLYLWARIALDYPIACSGKILAIYHQGGNNQASRSSVLFPYEFLVHALDTMLEDIANRHKFPEHLESYRNSCMRKGFFFLVARNDRLSALKWLNCSGITHKSVLDEFMNLKASWWFFRMAEFVRKMMGSRIFLNYAGGRRCRDGVVTKLFNTTLPREPRC